MARRSCGLSLIEGLVGDSASTNIDTRFGEILIKVKAPLPELIFVVLAVADLLANISTGWLAIALYPRFARHMPVLPACQ
ncbi:MAG: hypothetical protein WB930_04625 [Syntrophobacteraceae bacterium]